MSINPKKRFEIFHRDDFTCQYCGRRPDQEEVILHVDHVVSRKDGGTDDPENLITSCRDCNFGKGSKSIRKNTNTIEEVQKELDLAKERLEQIKEMNNLRKEKDLAEHQIFLNKTDWMREVTAHLFSNNFYSNVLSLIEEKGYDSSLIEESLRVLTDQADKKDFRTDKQVFNYFLGIHRNLSLPPEHNEILKMYRDEVFDFRPMPANFRNILFRYLDEGKAFHERVIRLVNDWKEDYYGKEFDVLPEVSEEFRKKKFTVFKNGQDLPLMVYQAILEVENEDQRTVLQEFIDNK